MIGYEQQILKTISIFQYFQQTARQSSYNKIANESYIDNNNHWFDIQVTILEKLICWRIFISAWFFSYVFYLVQKCFIWNNFLIWNICLIMLHNITIDDKSHLCKIFYLQITNSFGELSHCILNWALICF